MPRYLLLLRNGKAETVPPRPLKDSGKRQVQRIGTWLAGQGLMPDQVICAPSERAIVSAQKALKAGGAGASGIRPSPRLAPSGKNDPLGLLRDLPGRSKRVMLVAHRKPLERLARHLTGRRQERIGTGDLLWLKMPSDWSDLPKGCATLHDWIRPEDLPTRFPFPGPDAVEWRDRPAYYYRQSAVLPWRVVDGGLEILVITSSKRNHWVVPKGIHEPGLSAQVSAAHEAEEEAGVLGEVGGLPLGDFEVEKWGARCRVEVYPMKVTRIFDDREWQESHRERLWVTPEAAVAHLKHDGLKQIVTAFARAFRA